MNKVILKLSLINNVNFVNKVIKYTDYCVLVRPKRSVHWFLKRMAGIWIHQMMQTFVLGGIMVRF